MPWDNCRLNAPAAALGPAILEERLPENMAKRFLVMVVGAGMGSLAGLLIAAMGAGNAGLIGGALVGALLPLFVLGPPGSHAGN